MDFDYNLLLVLSVVGQVTEALGVQLLQAYGNIKSLPGRMISIFWGLLMITLGFLAVIKSLNGNYNDIDKALLVPLIGSLSILSSIGTTLKVITRFNLIRRATIRSNWQCDWLRRCVMLLNLSEDPDFSPEFNHYSAFVHLFDDVLLVTKPSVNRGVYLSVMLAPVYYIALWLQKLVQFVENVIFVVGRVILTRKFLFRMKNYKLLLINYRRSNGHF